MSPQDTNVKIIVPSRYYLWRLILYFLSYFYFFYPKLSTRKTQFYEDSRFLFRIHTPEQGFVLQFILILISSVLSINSHHQTQSDFTLYNLLFRFSSLLNALTKIVEILFNIIIVYLTIVKTRSGNNLLTMITWISWMEFISHSIKLFRYMHATLLLFNIHDHFT